MGDTPRYIRANMPSPWQAGSATTAAGTYSRAQSHILSYHHPPLLKVIIAIIMVIIRGSKV
jgi:hypothetical protein